MTFRSIKVGTYSYRVQDATRQIDLVFQYGLSDGAKVFELLSSFDRQEFRGIYVVSESVTSEQKSQGVVGGYVWEMSGVPDRPFKFSSSSDGFCSLRDLVVEAIGVYGSDGCIEPEMYTLIKFE